MVVSSGYWHSLMFNATSMRMRTRPFPHWPPEKFFKRRKREVNIGPRVLEVNHESLSHKVRRVTDQLRVLAPALSQLEDHDDLMHSLADNLKFLDDLGGHSQ